MGSITPSQQPQFLVIGAGSRGHAYARAVNVSTGGIIAAVAEPDPFKRQDFGRKFIWGDAGQPQEGQEFVGWKEWLDWELSRRQNRDTALPKITGVFICTLDETHAPIIQALAPLNLHILCEKPLALSLSDCLGIQRALLASSSNTSITEGVVQPSKIISIGHVLRYSPHNILLRDLLVNQKAIGEIVSIEHTEPVGWWHFAHSYVRGNWRRATKEGIGSLLTKSCHDIDFLLWLLCSSSPLTGERPHLPSTISSFGALTHFRKARKPKAAKDAGATNCTACPAERDCTYSAVKLYRDRWMDGEIDEGWPLKIVMPEIEDLVVRNGNDKVQAEKLLMKKLSEDYDRKTTPDQVVASRGWYGRCVYDSDNNVVDEQTVTMAWDAEVDDNNKKGENDDDDDVVVFGRGPKHAVFHMTYPTQAQCSRRGRIYGTEGEIAYDSSTITVYTFKDNKTTLHEIPKQNPEVEKSHGGGDWGLAGAFVAAVEAVESGKMSVEEAQRRYVGCDLDEVIRSHAVVFAAEEARQKREVVRFQQWWEEAQQKVQV